MGLEPITDTLRVRFATHYIMQPLQLSLLGQNIFLIILLLSILFG